MDSWYSAKRLLKQIRSYQWHFVTRLKQNHKFKEKKLREHWPHRFGYAEGELVGGITVLVVKDGCRYLAISQTSLSVIEVKAIYAKRQQVKEFFKLMRGQLRGISARRARSGRRRLTCTYARWRCWGSSRNPCANRGQSTNYAGGHFDRRCQSKHLYLNLLNSRLNFSYFFLPYSRPTYRMRRRYLISH